MIGRNRRLLSLCPSDGGGDRVCQVINSSCCRLNSRRGTVQVLDGCISSARGPLHDSLCVLNMYCFGGKGCDGAIGTLDQAMHRGSRLARGTCLCLKRSCLGLNSGGGTHVTFRTTTASSFSGRVGRITVCGCTLLVRRATFAKFNRSIAVFRSFLGSFPGSRCTSGIGSCLIRICLAAGGCRTTLGSVGGVGRPDAGVLRTGRSVLFRLKARTFTGIGLSSTIDLFDRTVRLNSCGVRTHGSTCF